MGMADDQGVDAHSAIDLTDSLFPDTGIDEHRPVAKQQESIAVGKPGLTGSANQINTGRHRLNKWEIFNRVHKDGDY